MTSSNNNSPKTPTVLFDVVVAEDSKNGNTYWHKAGVAFPLLNGAPGLRMKLDLYPGVRFYIKESLRSTGNLNAEVETENSEEAPF